jgi:hypothetical protein
MRTPCDKKLRMLLANLFLAEGNGSQEKILIPVGTAIIIVLFH